MLKVIFPLILLVVLTFSNSATAETPKGTLYKLFAALKSANNVSPLVEIVDWKQQFEALSAEQKEQMRVSSAEQLKNNYAMMAKSNGQFHIDSLKAEQTLSADGQMHGESMDFIQSLESELEDIVARNEELISRTKYIIEKTFINGDSAKIKLKKVYKGEESMLEIELHQVEDQWVTMNAGVLNPTGPGQGPIGNLPNPLENISLR